MSQFIMISQFIIGISILIALHELGHMLLAKLFGMRVESYNIGFPPKIIQFKWGETEYSLGAIPLGGSVKIAGMIDESLDTSHLSDTPQPWEFRAKPAWQRLLVILGGIICNALCGILIFVALTFWLGDTYLTKDEVNKHGITPYTLGATIGFEEGDQITHINGRDFTKFNEVMKPSISLTEGGYYTVLRQGQEVHLPITPQLLKQLRGRQGQQNFIAPRIPFEVDKVQASSAARAGLQQGDQIVEIAGQATPYFHQLQAALKEHAGKSISIQYVRNGVTYHTTAQVSTTGKLGFVPKILFNYMHQKCSILKAIAIGTSRAFEIVRINLMVLREVITGQVPLSQAMNGPIGIAQMFDKTFDWINFWHIVGLISIALAFTNLLPIPALDGGHMVLIICEMIVRRRLPLRLLQIVQIIGMVIVLLLTGYLLFSDLYKLFQ